VGHGDTGFDAKLVGLPGFALPNALNLRGMQGVELVLVFRLFLEFDPCDQNKPFCLFEP